MFGRHTVGLVSQSGVVSLKSSVRALVALKLTDLIDWVGMKLMGWLHALSYRILLLCVSL